MKITTLISNANQLLDLIFQVPCVSREELALRDKDPSVKAYYDNVFKKLDAEKAEGKWPAPQPIAPRAVTERAPQTFWTQPVKNPFVFLGLLATVIVTGLGGIVLGAFIE